MNYEGKKWVVRPQDPKTALQIAEALDTTPLVGQVLLNRGYGDIEDAIQFMIDEGENVRGFYLQNRLTLTNAEDLLTINLHFLKNKTEEYQFEAQEIGPGTNLLQPVCIEQGVVIGSGCKIGPNVYIEKDARIGDNVQLENVVVLRGAVISPGTKLSDQVVT